MDVDASPDTSASIRGAAGGSWRNDPEPADPAPLLGSGGGICAAAALAAALLFAAAAAAAQPVSKLPGISYQVLAAGPASGARALRGDTVSMRYVGRFADGEVFSASPKDGAEPMSFPVHDLIPGMSAALQLMRPGDRWRITIPSYLGYGAAGRKTVPSQARRDIPPDATLVFDVDLVAILPRKP